MTETEKKGLTALAPLAGVASSPPGLTQGAGKSGKPIAQAIIKLELPEFDPKPLPEWAEKFAEFLLLTGQSHVDVASPYGPRTGGGKTGFPLKKVSPYFCLSLALNAWILGHSWDSALAFLGT